jgi:endoglucanase
MSDTVQLAATLAALDSAFGVSGNEEEITAALLREMDGLYDEHWTDPLGNQYFVRHGKNPGKRAHFAAHMDEIGFIVKTIDENGFARLFPVGYHDDRMAWNQDLVFLTAEGKRVYGVTGTKPAHVMMPEDLAKPAKISDVFVDFGTGSAPATHALGLEIGDYGTFSRTGFFLNGSDVYSGKSVDNRAGLAVLVEAARRLRGREIEPEVCFAGTVQEEVGMRGGRAIAARFKPEQFFAVDGTLTGGTPGFDFGECPQKLGGGVSFKFFDWDTAWTCGNNVPRRLTRRMIEVARKHHIPFQREVMLGGGTDAWTGSLAGEGVLAGGVCIPMRYMHSAVGLVKLSDMSLAADYIVHYLEDYQSID